MCIGHRATLKGHPALVMSRSANGGEMSAWRCVDKREERKIERGFCVCVYFVFYLFLLLVVALLTVIWHW